MLISRLVISAMMLLPFLSTSQTSDKPNILWLTSEDNSASWIGCYGNPYAETPHIDQLAKDGFQYMNAFANAPVCSPSRSTWISGVYAISMGTHPMRSRYKIPHDIIKYYPDFLNEQGYFTANYKKTDYNIAGRPDDACWDSSEKEDWQKLKNNQPFFQVINYGSTHESRAFGDVENTKHDPDKTILAKYHPDVPKMRKNYAKYYDAIKKMDSEIGKALENLEKAGLADNTIVVYVSDHGGVLPRSKRFLFANSLHCPLVIRIPEKFKNLWPAENIGSQIERQVSFVDMPKTWISLAGATPPDYMHGKIFLGPNAEPAPDYTFSFRGRMDERIDNARALINDKYLYIRNYMPYAPWIQRMTYLWNMEASLAWEKEINEGRANADQSRPFLPKESTEELYDIKKDPDCVNNLIDDPSVATEVLKMRNALRNRQLEVYDAALIPETEMVRLAEANKTTMYEMARNPEIYNVHEILDAADLALAKDKSNLPQLREMIESEDLALRYWGTIGCFLLNDKEGGLMAIDDESDEIKAMAAWLLVNAGEKKKGIDALKDMIENRTYAMVMVLNVVDWIGDEAKSLLPLINSIEFEDAFKNEHKYEKRIQNHVLVRFGAEKKYLDDDAQ